MGVGKRKTLLVKVLTGLCRVENGNLHCPTPAPRLYSYEDARNKKTQDAASGTKVNVVRNSNIEQAVEQAVDGVGGMCSYVHKDDLVVIKPNIMGGNHNEESTFTNPRVTKKVIEMVEQCGGKPVVVDSAMIWTKFDTVVEKTGYKKWADENHIHLYNLEDLPRVKFDFGNFSTIKKTDVSKLLLDADVLIDVPAAKTHLFSGITVAMKNLYGLLPSADKAKYHARGINEVIVDVTRAMTPNLTIVDGTRGCEGYGPLWCERIPDYNLIIASNDPVCADATTAQFIGYKPAEIPSLVGAYREKLGNPLCKANTVAAHPKDGNWARPNLNTIKFIDQLTKMSTMLPNVVNWFNANADFYLGDLAFNSFTNKYLMRPVWGILDKVLGNGLYKQDEWYAKMINLSPFPNYRIHETIPSGTEDAINEGDQPLTKQDSDPYRA